MHLCHQRKHLYSADTVNYMTFHNKYLISCILWNDVATVENAIPSKTGEVTVP